jgi:hypothetical protein
MAEGFPVICGNGQQHGISLPFGMADFLLKTINYPSLCRYKPFLKTGPGPWVCSL